MKIDYIIESLNRLFEDARSLKDLLELEDAAWESLKSQADRKGFTLTDQNLMTKDGKVVVTIEDEDAWQKITDYLDIEDLKNEPRRNVTPVNVVKSVINPSASLKKIIITGTAQDLPVEEEVQEILNANIKSLGAEVSNVTVSKDTGTVTLQADVINSEEVKDEDLKKAIATNFDKVMKINTIAIK